MSLFVRALLCSKALRAQPVVTSCRRHKNITSDVPYESSISRSGPGSASSAALPNEVDAVIVGGGSVGCSLAYHLAKLNNGNVVLLERNRITSGTTWHTAGILWSYRPSESETLMQLQTRELISSILPEVTGEDAGWLKTGAIHVAKNEAQFNDLKQISTLAKALGAEVYEVGRKDVLDIHPLLRTDDVFGAVYSPGDGTMDPGTYCMALIKAAKKHGAKIIENCPVTGIVTTVDDMSHRRVCSVVTSLGVIKTKNVINCAGAWAPSICKMIGVRLPQLAYKHAYVVTEPLPGIRGTPMVKDHGTVYIKPQGEALQYGGYEKNSHLITNLPDDFSFGLYDLDWEIFEQHYTAAVNRLPDIEKVGIRSSVCGPESFTPDGRPNIGESPEVRGFYVGSAFNSGGMMLGGGAGRQLAHWVYHGKPEIDLFNCDIRRYPRNLSNYNKWLVETCHEKFLKRFGMIYKHDHGLGGRNQRHSLLHKIHEENGALFASKNGYERPAYYVNNETRKKSKLEVLPYDYYGCYGNKEHDSYPYYAAVMEDCTYDFPEKSHKLIGRECLTCRTSAVLFDMSFMAKYELSGPDVEAAAKLLFTRDVSDPDRMTYALMLNKDGGIESDVVVAKTSSDRDTVYYVTAPSIAEQYCFSHMERVVCDAGLNCQVKSVTETKAILSLQGPDSNKFLEGLVDGVSLSDLRYARWAPANVAGKEVILTRLSFVGEQGYEIHCDAVDAQHIYQAINDQNALSLAGYRAMESLSSEAGFPHWPQSICSSDNPAEAGLLQFCEETTNYIGSTVIQKLRNNFLKKRLVHFIVNCNVPIYGGEAIWRDDVIAGYLRTGEYSYVLRSNIGCGYLEINDAMKSLDDDIISEGKYEIERMGYRYPAKLYHKLLPSTQKRMQGFYDKQEQNDLKLALKATLF